MFSTQDAAKAAGRTPRHTRRIAEYLGIKPKRYGRTMAWTRAQVNAIVAEANRRRGVRA